jgi:hypothetical protein
MISPLPAEVDGDRWLSGPAGEVRAVRSTYPRSGMYRNDGSITPLWTVDWYAKRVDVASDGVHLVRHGPWASRTTDEALTVFANGAALRGYRVNELVDLPFLLPHSVSHFDWVDTEGFDDANMRYRVKTLDGNSFVFDVKSGQILSSSRRAWMRLSGAVLVVLLSVVAIVAFWRRLVARTASR